MSSLCSCVSVFLWGIKLVCPPAWQYEANLARGLLWLEKWSSLMNPKEIGFETASSAWVKAITCYIF